MNSSSPSVRRHLHHRRMRWLCAAAGVVLAASTLFADRVIAQSASQAADEEFFRAAETFSEVFHAIREKYVEEIDTQTLMEAAINGMFSALDPHSQFMPADVFDQLEQSTQGEFYGIGIHITIRDGLLTVIAPIPGTPSAELGIQPWDRIIEIDGESTQGMPLPDAVRRLKGPRGTQVTVRIFRASEDPDVDDQILDFTITRDEVEIESVFSRMLDGDIGYIRLAQFSQDSAADVRRAVGELREQGAKGFILDLRFNSGGLLQGAIEVSEVFVPRQSLIVSTDGRLPNQNRRYFSESAPETDLPLMVLINRGSASASEIVAGCMQDHRRGIIVGPEGDHSFGKASVQTIEEIRHTLDTDENGNPRRSAIRLTTAHYLTPNGRQIHETGIEPDIGVPLPRGHEGELLRRGLLGDPNTIEPEDHRRAVLSRIGEYVSPEIGLDEGEVAPEEVSPEERAIEPLGRLLMEDEQGNSVRELSIDDLAGEGRGSGEEFHDILLDEASRYLRVHLLIGGERS
ncbi:MAG: S41 family peptidase [Candidatus Sumerlaeia bacterium]|nr:S41 family peptidase [Candidatus Sumerlaeia bacterium]